MEVGRERCRVHRGVGWVQMVESEVGVGVK